MILASASPRRRDLFESFRLHPLVMAADIDETPMQNEDARAYVERMATTKVQTIINQLSSEDTPLTEDEIKASEVIVGADTAVWLTANKILGKPRDDEEAFSMLKALSGQTHHVSTGVCIATKSETGWQTRSFVDTCNVTFHDLSDAEIKAYVASKEPADKAGAYGIQGHGALLVDSIEGDFYTVVGLPIAKVIRMLDEMTNGTTGISWTEVCLKGSNHD